MDNISHFPYLLNILVEDKNLNDAEWKAIFELQKCSHPNFESFGIADEKGESQNCMNQTDLL